MSTYVDWEGGGGGGGGLTWYLWLMRWLVIIMKARTTRKTRTKPFIRPVFGLWCGFWGGWVGGWVKAPAAARRAAYEGDGIGSGQRHISCMPACLPVCVRYLPSLASSFSFRTVSGAAIVLAVCGWVGSGWDGSHLKSSSWVGVWVWALARAGPGKRGGLPASFWGGERRVSVNGGQGQGGVGCGMVVLSPQGHIHI